MKFKRGQQSCDTLASDLSKKIYGGTVRKIERTDPKKETTTKVYTMDTNDTMYSGNIQVGRRETSCHMGPSLPSEMTMILEESFSKLVNQTEYSILSKDLSFRFRVIKDLQQPETLF
jgi:hypothetical protein